MQLTVLGYVLVPIFRYNLWKLVLAYAAVMALVGAHEASSRPAYRFKVLLPALENLRQSVAGHNGDLYTAGQLPSYRPTVPSYKAALLVLHDGSDSSTKKVVLVVRSLVSSYDRARQRSGDVGFLRTAAALGWTEVPQAPPVVGWSTRQRL